MTAETNDELITALYCRLSVEDEKDKRVSDNESNSISNQKQPENNPYAPAVYKARGL